MATKSEMSLSLVADIVDAAVRHGEWPVAAPEPEFSDPMIAEVMERVRCSLVEVERKRQEDRVSPDALDACQKCHQFRGVHCSFCQMVICNHDCHFEYRMHGGNGPYVQSDPLTMEVIPLKSGGDMYAGDGKWSPWVEVVTDGPCPTCGHSLGAKSSEAYDYGRPICLACRAGNGNLYPATIEQVGLRDRRTYALPMVQPLPPPFADLGRCEEHDQPWDRGHLYGSRWNVEKSLRKWHGLRGGLCEADEPIEAAVARESALNQASLGDLMEQLESLGWTWAAFEKKVLRAPWEQWTAGDPHKRGTAEFPSYTNRTWVARAWDRFKGHLDTQEIRDIENAKQRERRRRKKESTKGLALAS